MRATLLARVECSSMPSSPPPQTLSLASPLLPPSPNARQPSSARLELTWGQTNPMVLQKSPDTMLSPALQAEEAATGLGWSNGETCALLGQIGPSGSPVVTTGLYSPLFYIIPPAISSGKAVKPSGIQPHRQEHTQLRCRGHTVGVEGHELCRINLVLTAGTGSGTGCNPTRSTNAGMHTAKVCLQAGRCLPACS